MAFTTESESADILQQNSEPPKKWTLDVVTDSDGEQVVVFTDEIMDHLNLKEGDTIKWIDREDGTWEIKKVEKEDE